MEKWKEIAEFKGYSVSNNGRVRTDDYNHTGKTKELKIFKNERGYIACNLMRGGLRKRKTIHQLVAVAFIDNPESYTQINHKNGIKSDNSVQNLEWCSASHNINHASANGLLKAAKGDKHYNIKVTDEEVREIRKLREFGMRLNSIAKLYGICFQHVSGIFHRTQRL